MDNGGAIQVKQLAKTGKEPPNTPPLVRAHPTGRVTALSYSPFHEDLLLSAGDANATVKVWKLPSSEPMIEDLVTPLTSFQETQATVAGIVPHPSADSVVATFSRPGALRIYDLEAETMRFEVVLEGDTALSSAAWNWDGSAMVMATQDQALRLLDPRTMQISAPVIEAAHTGKRHLSVVWCGRTQHFMTCGSDRMQERELKLWDPRQLSKCVHRERLDAGGVGQLFPLYDADLDLLYVLGKGDRSARLFEVDLMRAPYVHALDHSALGSMTLAATLLPKATCDTNDCEVARVLNLSASGSSVGGSCEVVSYRVPRKEATHTFQSDLYPDTLAAEAAMTSTEWQEGHNAEPKVRTVTPTAKPVEDVSGSVFGRMPAPSGWGAPPASAGATANGWQTSGWGQSLSSTASSNAASKVASDVKTGWSLSTRKWNEPEPMAQNAPPSPAQWNSDTSTVSTAPPTPPSSSVEKTEDVLTPIPATTSDEWPSAGVEPMGIADVVELSDKAQRLGAKYGHKLKYVQGKEALRNDVFHFGDKRVAFSTQASPVIAANATFWAAPIAGAGGPVLVEKLDANGKARHGAAPVINGQKAEVSTLAFNPFKDHVLATGSADSTIQIWSLDSDTISDRAGKLTQTLSGHTKSLRSLEFNPTAADVLCSSSLDLSLRFWDIEVGQEKLCLDGKLDDITWNMAFSPDGALLATASRAKIVRVFDPRQSEQALVAMGCGYESNKPQFVTWADSTRLLTVGVSARIETLVSFWDSRNLLEPLGASVMVDPAASAASTTTPIPLYDASSHLLFLIGTGSRHIWSYEVDPGAATVQANLPFMLAGTDTIGGVALLPKAICDIRDVELARLLVATLNVVQRVSFSLPRAQKLKEFFQDDVYGLVPKPEPSVTAAQWFMGETGAPVYESLRPDGMVALSEKPKDTTPVRPKTLDFQARKREEEEKERQKAAQFARLSNLSAQPTLHSTHHTGVNPTAPQGAEVDSDDDWDD
ncbi:coronin-like protein [Phytophthora infestans T30-4]|uniref:Coronin n=1 Tax=Phytophthora infestans (strain T30-4) TaxID=403677 RepID=D0MT77_PHYIT|nr:coronin-like protein [Phytophthora infestans T30-4]EEY61174.1 coronin-like protein [Phytophthora infestans T30-4]|eukprot:XP_002908091.1 coronin-like protein [Phytophthora infestans T30-4]